MDLLRETELVPAGEESLKRGEFVTAYRNFLKDHRADQLKVIKQDAWWRVTRLYQLPEAADALYGLVDPYRRGYFVARDLPGKSIDEMREEALADLALLEEQAAQSHAARQ